MYREAQSLKALHRRVNALAPDRSRASDGWIGDEAHATRDSDHNPWVTDAQGIGVVRARDFTHDPAGGCDAGVLAESLAELLGVHPALGPGAYVIFDRRIISTNRIVEGWRPYSGANPHTAHVHLSVGRYGYDSTAAWPVRVTRRASTVRTRRHLTRAARSAKNLPPRFLRRIRRIRSDLKAWNE